MNSVNKIKSENGLSGTIIIHDKIKSKISKKIRQQQFSDEIFVSQNTLKFRIIPLNILEKFYKIFYKRFQRLTYSNKILKF